MNTFPAEACVRRATTKRYLDVEEKVLDEGLPAPLWRCSKLPSMWGELTPVGWMFSSEVLAIRDMGASAGLISLYAADRCVDPRYPCYYYEACIEAVQIRHSSICIKIGLMVVPEAEHMSAERPSTKSLISHSDLFPRHLKAFVTGPSFSTPTAGTLESFAAGDVLGCGVSRIDGRIFYTKNGIILGFLPCSIDELKEKLCPVVQVSCKNHYLEDLPPFLRITTNFGWQEFTFDICHFAREVFSQRRRMFQHDAASLPQEIVNTIAVSAANSERFDLAALSRFAMVCRTWGKICRPSMYHYIDIKNVTQLSRLHVIFRSPGVLPLLREVHVGGKSTDLHDKAPRPSLALALSSLGRHFWQPAKAIGWSEGHIGENRIRSSHITEPHVRIQEAPPRIETAISALLRPLQNLHSLQINRIIFHSLTSLFRVIRGLSQVEDVHLGDVTVLHAPEHLYWPPSVVLTKLQVLKVTNCKIPTRAAPAFVSLGVQGKPDLVPSPAGISRLSRQLNGILLHADDEYAMQQIAQAVERMHTLFGDDAGQTQCTFNLMEDQEEKEGQATQYLSVSRSDLLVKVHVTRLQESNESPQRIKAVTVILNVLPQDPTSGLIFLDTSLADISQRTNPPLKFGCEIQGWNLGRTRLNAAMPLLHAEGRLIVKSPSPGPPSLRRSRISNFTAFHSRPSPSRSRVHVTFNERVDVFEFSSDSSDSSPPGSPSGKEEFECEVGDARWEARNDVETDAGLDARESVEALE